MAGLWSFPSGLVNKNESLIAGMEREVFEETGLAIKYRGIFYIRQVEFTKWELPDVYFAILADL
jgi:ADP-ribose pyrophosphatase YjhB (NUDIX family)